MLSAFLLSSAKEKPISLTPLSSGVITVSYTHLDVYKRQMFVLPTATPVITPLLSTVATVASSVV